MTEIARYNHEQRRGLPPTIDSRRAEASIAADLAILVSGSQDDDSGPLQGCCALCDRATTRLVCPSCELRVNDSLNELADLVDQLSEDYLSPVVRGGSGGGSSGKPGSKPPLSIAVLSLLGQDSQTDHSPTGPIEDQTGSRSVLSVLSSWAHAWSWQITCDPTVMSPTYVRTQSQGSSPTVRQAVEWLQYWNSWAIDEFPGYLDFYADVRSLIAACRQAMERPPSPVFVGLCPIEVESGCCSAKLYVLPGARMIKCGRCSNEWPKYEWRQLGAAITRADRHRDLDPDMLQSQ